jgi:mono/diheme cytochrome c family protein
MKNLAKVLAAAMAASAMFVSSPALAADKKVERMWKAKCSGCHGMDGKGQTEKGKKMKVADMTTPEFQKGTDDDFKKLINEGVKVEKDGVKKEMDPFKSELKPPEVDAFVAFIRELAAK